MAHWPSTKSKSSLQYVVLEPWRSGPVGKFYNPLKGSSSSSVFFLLLKKECSLS